ncbi:DUF4159 domain-containing protein [Candidatus Sumerlaeota bacterium]
MRIPRHLRNESSADKALDALLRAVALTHRLVAAALLFLGRRLERALAKVPWSGKLGLLAAILGAIAVRVALVGGYSYQSWARLDARRLEALEQAGLLAAWGALAPLMLAIGVLLLVCGLLAFRRARSTHRLLKIAAAGFLVLDLWALVFLARAPAILHATLGDGRLLEAQFTVDLRNYLWVLGFGGWLPTFVGGLILLLAVSLRSVSEFYGRPRSATLPLADRVVHNLRTHGADPEYRASTYWSTFIHILILLILPLIAFIRFRQKAYEIPRGSGNPVAQLIKVKKIKKKPKKRFVFNPNSAISFWRPDIDDSKVIEEVDKETENQYQATELAGKLGKGGGKKGGWPNGMENARVRFIRLRYEGGDWDQQMGKGADYNFLIKFHELTGFKIAAQTEAVTISDLKRFPKHKAPPFVYLTGQRHINVSQRDIKTLRWYLLEEGGMIFADNGGGNFNWAFRNLMRRVLPDKQWIDIANDDIIFRQPYIFPHGAPPLWHHSGTRALGIKHQGRWVVFYHQGDINDAWQEGGSGISASLRKAAFQLGVNVVNYSFNQYLSLHYGQ